MRTWSGFSVDGEKTSVAGKYGYTVLPGVDGPGASTVGGYNVGISAYSDAPATARDFLEFMQTKKSQTYFTEVGGAPVLSAVYDDPAVLAQFPYFATLKEALATAQPRPRHAVLHAGVEVDLRQHLRCYSRREDRRAGLGGHQGRHRNRR